ncbi:hypothetical protein JTB14_036721 [Gonioctena quinquepunctata]|nr:hypothetical protein JTB14_036721 [Gonioctena quinquepunctata]
MRWSNINIGATYLEVNAITNGTKEWIQDVKIENNPMKLKLDTGSQTNLLPYLLEGEEEEEEDISLENIKDKLISYTGIEIELKRECLLKS